MISVKATEQGRKFTVRIGEKRIGEVHVYESTGRIASYVLRDGEMKYSGQTNATIRQAVNCILITEGYGKSSDVAVQRARGGMKG